jgi:nicotinate-nucleotide pyrophosphorylase (carboxylating)
MMQAEITQIIKNALEEDIRTGDITTLAIMKEPAEGKGIFLLKSNGVVAGLKIAEEVFTITDNTLQFRSIASDGEYSYSGSIIAEVSGNISSILTAERTALNFLQRMSGIATAANSLSSLVKHTKAKIIDTRKTVPGLRILDKLSVKIGGCLNHRMGLYDMFLIKDNHIVSAGSISKAVAACQKYRSEINPDIKIEVETTNIEEVAEALEAGTDIIMLDNFSVPDMKEAVKLVDGRTLLEASGMVTGETVAAIAETGVDFISVGKITHSVNALDISLEIERNDSSQT